MRFVTVKSVDQQAMLAWHRARAGFGEERKALLNRTRGLLAEFGVWLGRSSAALIRHLPQLALDDRLPARFRPILSSALNHLRNIEQCIAECDSEIHNHVRHSEQAQRIQALGRHRASDRQRADRHRVESSRLQERSPDGGLDRPRAETKQLRR
jgi:transposase